MGHFSFSYICFFFLLMEYQMSPARGIVLYDMDSADVS